MREEASQDGVNTIPQHAESAAERRRRALEALAKWGDFQIITRRDPSRKRKVAEGGSDQASLKSDLPVLLCGVKESSLLARDSIRQALAGTPEEVPQHDGSSPGQGISLQGVVCIWAFLRMDLSAGC